MVNALSGTRTDPVMRNSSTSVTSAMSARAHGRREWICCSKSTRKAALPVTYAGMLPWEARTADTSRSPTPPRAPAGPEPLRDLPLRRAGGKNVDHRQPPGHGLNLHGLDAGHRGDLASAGD